MVMEAVALKILKEDQAAQKKAEVEDWKRSKAQDLKQYT